MPEVYYMAVSADEYELPVFAGDTATELAFFLKIRTTSVLASLCRSPDGYVTTRDGKMKYLRINADTGEIFVGKLPADIAAEKSKRKKGQRK